MGANYEIHEPSWLIASERTKGQYIDARRMTSVSGLNIHAVSNSFYFLDAHWDHRPHQHRTAWIR